MKKNTVKKKNQGQDSRILKAPHSKAYWLVLHTLKWNFGNWVSKIKQKNPQNIKMSQTKDQ